jgi:isoamylase
MKIGSGKPYPLGATWDRAGVNFALFSENATAVDLCLLALADSMKETSRIPLRERTGRLWHIYAAQLVAALARFA